MPRTLKKTGTITPIKESSAPSEQKQPALPFFAFVAVIAMLVGYVSIGIFLNHIRIEEEANVAPTRRIQDLVNLLTQAQSKQASLESELAQLQGRLKELSVGNAAHPISNRAVKDISRDPEYQKLLRQAGLTQIKGPGIVVTLNESGAMANAKPGQGRDSGNRIQSDDLLKLVNDLKAAGATDISINDQRLVSTSAIVNAGPVLMVNQTRIDSPIVIRALGDPQTLRSSLQIRGGILEYLNFFGIKGEIETRRKMAVPAYQLANF